MTRSEDQSTRSTEAKRQLRGLDRSPTTTFTLGEALASLLEDLERGDEEERGAA